MSSADPYVPVASSSSTTIRSLDALHTHLDPTTPPHYLTHHIIHALLRKGFHGAEAGALTEIEHLLEHHIQSVFSGSRDYARLAGRAKPNAFDLLKAREEVDSSSVRRLRKEAKRRRPGIKLEMVDSPPSPDRPTTLQDLPPLNRIQDDQKDVDVDMDRKPDLSKLGDRNNNSNNSNVQAGEEGLKPIYGFDGVPSLPPKWAYPSTTAVRIDSHPTWKASACAKGGEGVLTRRQEEVPEETPHGQITKRSLDFVKLTASERGDIPSELGVVNYRKGKKRLAA